MPDTPHRVQRKRTKGWRMPPNTVYVGRPTKWGNPFYAGMYPRYTAADAVADYRRWVNREPAYAHLDVVAERKPPSRAEIRRDLRGWNLACWCELDDPCHADVLLEVANG